VKKMTAMTNTVPAAMATQAANWKTLGARYDAGSVAAGAGAVAVEDRTVGVSDVSLMRHMMRGLTVVAAMRYLCSSCELKTGLTWRNRRDDGPVRLSRPRTASRALAGSNCDGGPGPLRC
jgi:hypothetical protein